MICFFHELLLVTTVGVEILVVLGAANFSLEPTSYLVSPAKLQLTLRRLGFPPWLDNRGKACCQTSHLMTLTELNQVIQLNFGILETTRWGQLAFIFQAYQASSG